MLALFSPVRNDDRGVTTIEWLGMAAIAVLVVAFLLPQVRGAARDLWSSIVGELDSFFG
jgi:Flp pilus assembly pilin Flp